MISNNLFDDKYEDGNHQPYPSAMTTTNNKANQDEKTVYKSIPTNLNEYRTLDIPTPDHLNFVTRESLKGNCDKYVHTVRHIYQTFALPMFQNA